MRAAGGHAADSYESPMVLRIVMVCAMAGMFMQTLDQTIANVALPHMQGSLAASRDQITWVLTSYIVRSEDHTSELQSHHDLVCRLLLEKKKKKTTTSIN